MTHHFLFAIPYPQSQCIFWKSLGETNGAVVVTPVRTHEGMINWSRPCFLLESKPTSCSHHQVPHCSASRLPPSPINTAPHQTLTSPQPCLIQNPASKHLRPNLFLLTSMLVYLSVLCPVRRLNLSGFQILI